jgi:mono/diheme cytochrome c family protein
MSLIQITMIRRTFFCLSFGALVSTAATAAVDFSRDIQPVLAEHCFHCHGNDEHARKGGLRLDLRAAALKGGEDDGSAITPGKPEASAIIARIESHDRDEVMPPPKEKKPLKPQDIAKLRQWIKEGAVYSGHWAFEGPRKGSSKFEIRDSKDGGGSSKFEVRDSKDGNTPADASTRTSNLELRISNLESRTSPVDFFIQQRLTKEGLQPSPPAEPEILCRRLHLDLIGLPPTPAALDSFAKDAAARGLDVAVAALADSLMKDRRFGEKWARHWLDVARYADSNGFEKDLPRAQWAWRDWVIDALNRDLPYDQFVIEQIAGDLLPNATRQQVVATGFLRNGMVNEEGAIIPEEWRMEGMFDRMDVVGSGLMGLSLKCAQCHTHKFDPISHNEYFGLFAFLNNTYDAQSWAQRADAEKKTDAMWTEIRRIEDELKKADPDWAQKIAAWEAAELESWRKTPWTVVHAVDTHSSTELNHPAVLPDDSILSLGHPTTSGDLHLFAEPKLENVSAIRVEILTHGDLPMRGPGRSYKGSWALTELVVETQAPGSKGWERRRLKNATADFEEAVAGMEPEWVHPSAKDNPRLRGPVAFMVDGDNKTAWRADRGPGRRNVDSVAVAQFETPLTLPPGTRMKVAIVIEHGNGGNGDRNAMVGRFRVALTSAPDAKVTRTPYAALLAMQTPDAQRTDAQRQAIFDAWRAVADSARKFHGQIEKQWQGYTEMETSVLHLAERRGVDVRETRRLDRGVWNQGKEVVQPHVLQVLHPLPDGASKDRLTFARWLVDKRSPLAARVAVNRLWQAVFGTGIVETADDFGTRAPEPSHRELLDWLAVDFMENGWSQKHLLRTLLTSATYRQSSRVSKELLERDPQNRLLARGPRFRAEAEVLRDIALSASGLLADKFGGPSIFPPMPASVLEYNYVKPDYWKPAEDATRYSRALYIFRKRSMPDPTMTTFDAPTADFACTRRPRSNSPLAALTTMNEPIFVEAAQALARRVLREAGPDDAARIDHAFRLCTSRLPTAAERTSIVKLLTTRRERLKRGDIKAADLAFSRLTQAAEIPADATPNELAAWTIVARVLLNLDETVAKN